MPHDLAHVKAFLKFSSAMSGETNSRAARQLSVTVKLKMLDIT